MVNHVSYVLQQLLLVYLPITELQIFDSIRYHEQFLDQQYGDCEFISGGYIISKKSYKVNLLPRPSLENDIINEIASFSYLASHGTSLGVRNSKILKKYFGEVYEDFKGIAPVLGPTFGVISTILKYKLSSNEYSKDVLLEYIKQSLEAFSEEIMLKLDELDNHLDFKVIELERDVLFKKVLKLRNAWIDCGKYNDNSELNDCLNRKALIVDSDMPLYLIKQDDYKRQIETIKDIKQLEIHLLIFREYVFNYILLFQTAIVSQQLLNSVESDEYFTALSTKLMASIKLFSKYVSWSHDQILKAHRQNYCLTTFKCKKLIGDVNKQQAYLNCSCAFNKMDETRVCTIQLKYPGSSFGKSESSVYRNSAKKILMNLKDKYDHGIGAELKTFWKTEIFDVVKSWENIARKTKENIS